MSVVKESVYEMLLGHFEEFFLHFMMLVFFSSNKQEEQWLFVFDILEIKLVIGYGYFWPRKKKTKMIVNY